MVEKAKVIEKHRQEGVPLDLEEVCFQAARIIKEKNWKTCFVLAHKSDVAACKRILHGYGVLVTGEIVVNPNVW